MIFELGRSAVNVTKASRQMVRISKFSEVPFFGFSITTCPFCKLFTLTTLPIFNISISDKFQAGGSGSHFQARANEDLGSVDVQTYLQFSDMACG